MRAGSARCSRRALLRTAALGAAALGVAACGTPGTAHPTVQHAVLNVPFELYVVGIPLNSSVTALIQQFVDSTFNARHRGVRAVWQPQAGGANLSAVVTAMAAGGPVPALLTGPGGSWPTLLPFLAPLDSYLRAQNVNSSLWSPGQLSAFRVAGALYALPNNAASEAYLYRQDILDALGLPYPDPAWTYLDAQRLWQACTSNPGGVHRFGCTVPFGPGTAANPVPEGLAAVVHGFGGAFRSADHTRCLLSEPGSIRCGEYFLDLVWSGVATSGDGYPNPGIFSGQVVFTQGAAPTIIEAVQKLGSGAKWDFVPYPSFPVRPVGILHDNFYGINALAPNKELAWELLRFAAIDTEWTRFYMRLALAPPGQAPLLEEWEVVLRSVAPVLQTKALSAWTEPTRRGDGFYDYEFFRYLPLQAVAAFGGIWPRMWNHQLDVAAGFGQLAAQIDAIEATGASEPAPTAASLIAAQKKRLQRLAAMFAPPAGS